MLPAPSLAGRFTLRDLLGEGTAGIVWRAWDHERAAWCAVKVMRPAGAASAGLRERFRREAEALARASEGLPDDPTGAPGLYEPFLAADGLRAAPTLGVEGDAPAREQP